MSQNATVNVDIKLGVNKFHVDEGHPHIILAANPDINEFRKSIPKVPAGYCHCSRIVLPHSTRQVP
ncbi:hypothetical protein ACUOA8_48885, partial [Escherichia sp. SS-MK2]